MTIDADTEIEPDAIRHLVRHFSDPLIGAVAGNVKVGNRDRWLTRWQALEYITSQNMEKRAFDLLNCITVVPGALGAWRKAAIEAAGGITADTVAEDADLTIAIRRLGWRITYDEYAVAWTEAPETPGALIRQRFPLDLRHAAVLLEAQRHAVPAEVRHVWVGSLFPTSFFSRLCCR